MKLTRRGERVVTVLLAVWVICVAWFGRGIIWPGVQF